METQLIIDYNFGGGMEQHVAGNPEHIKDFFRSMPGNNRLPKNLFVYDSAGKSVHVISGFYEALGKYLLDNLDPSDIIGITGTLEEKNNHQRAIGDITYEPPFDIGVYLKVISSDDFENTSWDNLLSDEIAKYEDRTTASVDGMCNYVGRFYLHEMGALNWGGHRSYLCGSEENGFENKYPELEKTIRELWISEVCKNMIDPIVDKLAGSEN